MRSLCTVPCVPACLVSTCNLCAVSTHPVQQPCSGNVSLAVRSAICLPALSCTPVPCLCWSRYFLSAAEDSRSEFADLRPGQLSGDMRAALGLGPLDPPPWLQRMRELGYPPGWRCALIQNPKGLQHIRALGHPPGWARALAPKFFRLPHFRELECLPGWRCALHQLLNRAAQGALAFSNKLECPFGTAQNEAIARASAQTWIPARPPRRQHKCFRLLLDRGCL